MRLTTGTPIRTRTIQYSEREVIGEHPEGGYRVSSSDGIGEYRTWWDDGMQDYRCTCPARPDKCPHVKVLLRWLHAQRVKRWASEGEAEEYPIDRALTDALTMSDAEPAPTPARAKRLEDIFPE